MPVLDNPPVSAGEFLQGVVESAVSSVLQPLVYRGKFSAFNEDGTTNFNGVANFSDIPVWG